MQEHHKIRLKESLKSKKSESRSEESEKSKSRVLNTDVSSEKSGEDSSEKSVGVGTLPKAMSPKDRAEYEDAIIDLVSAEDFTDDETVSDVYGRTYDRDGLRLPAKYTEVSGDLADLAALSKHGDVTIDLATGEDTIVVTDIYGREYEMAKPPADDLSDPHVMGVRTKPITEEDLKRHVSVAERYARKSREELTTTVDLRELYPDQMGGAEVCPYSVDQFTDFQIECDSYRGSKDCFAKLLEKCQGFMKRFEIETKLYGSGDENGDGTYTWKVANPICTGRTTVQLYSEYKRVWTDTVDGILRDNRHLRGFTFFSTKEKSAHSPVRLYGLIEFFDDVDIYIECCEDRKDWLMVPHLKINDVIMSMGTAMEGLKNPPIFAKNRFDGKFEFFSSHDTMVEFESYGVVMFLLALANKIYKLCIFELLKKKDARTLAITTNSIQEAYITPMLVDEDKMKKGWADAVVLHRLRRNVQHMAGLIHDEESIGFEIEKYILDFGMQDPDEVLERRKKLAKEKAKRKRRTKSEIEDEERIRWAEAREAAKDKELPEARYL